MISPSEHDTALSDLKLTQNVMVASLNEQINNAGRECEDLNRQIVVCLTFSASFYLKG